MLEGPSVLFQECLIHSKIFIEHLLYARHYCRSVSPGYIVVNKTDVVLDLLVLTS